MARLNMKPAFGISILLAVAVSHAAQNVQGTVYEDANSNGWRDAGEKGIAGVKVSNGKDVVVTDSQGKYRLPLIENSIVFISKPSGWLVPLDDNNHPVFYKAYYPNGSPKMTFPGFEPTGALPSQLDFALKKTSSPKKFEVLLFGDTQPYSVQQIDFLRHEIIAETIGSKALFGVTMGDVVGDRLNLHPETARAHALIGIPWHYVPGNHDRNLDAGSAEHEFDYFKTQYGPTYYSFDEGEAHFVVMENIKGEGKGPYKPGVDATQLKWLKNDLAKTPKDRLIVLLVHIPLFESFEERKEILEALAPFKNTVSFAAHWHAQKHGFLGKPEGWPKDQPHQSIVVGTTSGCWWGGEFDSVGLPMAIMSDGTPQGYMVLSVDGTSFKLRYKVSRRPADYQMNIVARDGLKSVETEGQEVVVNVFLASSESKVEMSIDGGGWMPMVRELRNDPNVERIVQLQRDKKLPATGGPISGPNTTDHIWVGKLPKLSSGVHVIRVRAKDIFGQTVNGIRAIRVE